MTNETRRAAKYATRNEIASLCGREPDAVRALCWMNGARREQGEIVSMLTAVNMDRDDLDTADEQKVENAIGVLSWMVGEEWLITSLVGLKTYYAPCEQFAGRNTI